MRGNLVRRLLGICAVAVTMFAAFAVAQNGLPGGTIVVTSATYPALASTSSLAVHGIATAAEAASARGIGVTSNRAVYIAPADSSLVGTPAELIGIGGQMVPSTLAIVAGKGVAGFAGDGGAATAAEFSLSQDSLVKRSGIAVAADGAFFIADTKNATIRAVAGATSSEPGIIRSVVGKWAPAQNDALIEPLGIAVDRAGKLYIADHTAGTVSVLTKATGRMTVLAHVASPASLAVTTDGTKVFVASPETGGVFAVTTLNGSVSTVPGFAPVAVDPNAENSGPCAAIESAAGLATSAKTSNPTAAASGAICPAGLAADGRGNLFVADANSGKILRVDAATGKTTAAAVGMLAPGDIAFDSQGDLFVSEQGRNRIIALGQLGDPPSNLILVAPAPPAGCTQGASFTYCNEPSGGTSPSFGFTLTNTSATAISGITITPAFVSTGTQPPPPPTNFTTTSTSCTGTLAAGANCLINVAFTPLAAGAISGQLIVTDGTPSDAQTVNLAGTGDDFSLAIVSGHSPEVTVSQGNTATFMAQLNADSIFGQHGEKVTLACPTNLPRFTECEFKPCPVTPTVGGATPFSILIHTSTVLNLTPPIPNPCNSPSAAVQQHRAGGPSGVLYVTTTPQQPPGDAPGFPALIFFAAMVVMMAAGAGAMRSSGRAGLQRAFAVLVLVAVASGLVAACHSNSNPNSTATPTGQTVMTVTANAVDSSGNSMHASRGIQITLDVIKQSQTIPVP